MIQVGGRSSALCVNLAISQVRGEQTSHLTIFDGGFVVVSSAVMIYDWGAQDNVYGENYEGKSSSRGQAVKAADIDGRLPGSAPHSPPQRSDWIRVYDIEQLSYEAGKEYKWCYCCVYRVR